MNRATFYPLVVLSAIIAQPIASISSAAGGRIDGLHTIVAASGDVKSSSVQFPSGTKINAAGIRLALLCSEYIATGGNFMERIKKLLVGGALFALLATTSWGCTYYDRDYRYGRYDRYDRSEHDRWERNEIVIAIGAATDSPDMMIDMMTAGMAGATIATTGVTGTAVSTVIITNNS